MSRKVVIQILICVGCIAILTVNQGEIRTYQDENDLNRMANNSQIPPSLAFTTFTLGPMRGLIVDALWSIKGVYMLKRTS